MRKGRYGPYKRRPAGAAIDFTSPHWIAAALVFYGELPIKDAAEACRVGTRTVRNCVRRAKTEGILPPRPLCKVIK